MRKCFLIYRLLFAFLFIHLSSFSQNTKQATQHSIDLAGKWQFQIDSNDVGVTEKWYNTRLKEVVTLPGSMAENGKGDDITLQTKWTGTIYDSSFYFNPRLAKYRQPGNIHIPFWLTPAKYYVGAAWYQKEVDVPKDWTGQHITLFLERCHWETQVSTLR